MRKEDNTPPWEWASHCSTGLHKHPDSTTTQGIAPMHILHLPFFCFKLIHKLYEQLNTQHTYLCCDLEVFVLLQQLLRVVNAGTSGCVC